MARAARPQLMLVPPPRLAEPDATTPSLRDGALIAGLKARDLSLSSAFYDRVRPIVDRTLGRLLGARDPDYNDVAQHALFELVDTIDRFRGECPLDAWISIVTARAAYRQIRRRRIERRLFDDLPPDEATSTTSSHGAKLAARQAIERLRAVLSKLDANRVWTFLLHDVYGYDLAEIGQIMGSSLSATQSRLVRGRREVHERIHKNPALARFLDQFSEGG